ncbi:MAG TPA: thioredoxin family protein [Thermomicrobiales bacterium]|nr:thioredoxin family protein [Thermomicrobiales bacterium]
MAVTRERFEQGMSYDEYKAQMTRNRERLEANERDLQLTDAQLAPFKNLKQPLNVLVLGEDWCGDVIANLPILARIAQESGKLNLRIFLRDQNLDLMDQYLKNGEFRSIPVFAFLDDNFNEVGRFIERPNSVTELRAQKRRELFAQNPRFGSPDTPIDQLPEDVRTDLMQATNAMREETAPFANREVVRELGEIAGRAA